MREIIDTPVLRQIKILELLFFSDEWIFKKQIAKQIGNTEKTVSRDINILKKRWGKLLDLELSPTQGVKVHNQSVAVMGRLFNELFKESRALNLLEVIFLNPHKGIEFFEASLFTSQSTLNRIFSKLNKILSPMGFAIENDKKKYSFNGVREVEVRNFYTSFFLQMYGMNLEGFPFSVDFYMFSKTVSKDLFPNSSENDNLETAYFSMYCMVSLIRESQGFTIEPDQMTEYKISDHSYSYIRSIFPQIKRKNLYPIFDYVHSIVFLKWETPEEERLIKREAKKLLATIFEEFQMAPAEVTRKRLEDMVCQLYITQKLSRNNYCILFNRTKYFAMSFYRLNPKAYKFIEKQLERMSEKTEVDFAKSIYSFIFWLHNIYPEFRDSSHAKSVLVVSDYGTEHAEFLKQRLLMMYNKDLDRAMNVDALSYTSFLRSRPKNNYDIVVTTIPIKKVKNETILLVDDYMSANNYCTLFMELQK